MGKNTTSTSSQLKRATYASITQGALVLWPAKTHGNLGARYQRVRRILQTGGLRGSIRVRHLLDVCMSRWSLWGAERGWADVGLWVAVYFLAKISSHRPTCKTTFERLTQSQAISQSFRVFISFRSRRDMTFFHFSKLFYTKLPFPLPWWSKDLLVDRHAGGGQSTSKSTCEVPARTLTAYLAIDQHPAYPNGGRLELWPGNDFFRTKSVTLSMLIDLLASTMSCRSTQVKIASTELWPQEMFTFSEMLALVESESSFGADVCHIGMST